MRQTTGRTKRRKHNPEILRFKKAARALGLEWRAVCAERDRLRELELDLRRDDDDIRRYGWILYSGAAAEPFWRGGFRRKFGSLMASGGDVDSIPRSDDLAQELRAICPQCASWSTEDIWDLLLSEYQPIKPITEHYEGAIYNLMLGADSERRAAGVPF